MIDFADAFHVKTPGGRLHKLTAFLHRAANSKSLFPKPVHTLPIAATRGAERLVDLHNPDEVRLVILSDLHLPKRGAVHKLERALEEIGQRDPQPDAILVTGDLAQNGRERYYQVLRDRLESTGRPYFVIPGNHDLGGLLRGGYQRVFAGPIDFSIDCGAVRLLMIGSCDHHIDAAALAWLDEQLRQHTTIPHLVFMHFHPLPIRLFSQPAVLGRWLDTALLDNVNDLLRVVFNRGNVRALFHGHCHLSLDQQLRGVRVIGTGSLSAHQPGMTPRPSYRTVAFSPDRLAVTTKFLDAESVENEAIHVVDDLYRA